MKSLAIELTIFVEHFRRSNGVICKLVYAYLVSDSDFGIHRQTYINEDTVFGAVD